MAVQLKKKEPSLETAEPTTPPAPRLLELTVINRYVVEGVLYEKGKTYSFDDDKATQMLRLQDDRGIPVFRVYRPKPKPVQVHRDGPVVVDMTGEKPSMRETVSDGTRVLNIGDDSELIEAGIPINEGGGDMSLNDLSGGGVTV